MIFKIKAKVLSVIPRANKYIMYIADEEGHKQKIFTNRSYKVGDVDIFQLYNPLMYQTLKDYTNPKNEQPQNNENINQEINENNELSQESN